MAEFMEKEIIFTLVDSLQELSHLPLEQMPERIVDSIRNWAQPTAVIAKITEPGKHVFQNSFGEQNQLEILAGLEKKFLSLEANSGLLNFPDKQRQIVAASRIKSPMGHHGLIMALINTDNPLRHIADQILDLYSDQVILALAMQPARAIIDIEDVLPKASQVLLHMGVEGILACDRKLPHNGYWIQKQGKSRELTLDDNLVGQLGQPGIIIKDKTRGQTSPILPSNEEYDTIAWDDFTVGDHIITVLFAGKFKETGIIFSRFRSLLAEIYTPTGYEEIARAFRQLLDDHRQVIKGERVAAILETAVAVNHEINNPLTAILGNTQLILLNKDKLSKDLLTKINIIEKSALRIRQVTQKLMTVIEPITTPYVDGLQMLDIDKSSASE
jgi:hypothetical protein